MEEKLKILPNVLITDICQYLYGEDLIRVSEMDSRFMKILSNDHFLKKKSLEDFNKRLDKWDVYINYTSNKHVTRYSLYYNALEKASMIHDMQLIDLFINKNYIRYGLLGAATGGHLDIVKLMLEKGANDYNGAFRGAVQYGHIDVVKLMLEKGANNYKYAISRAAEGGYIDIVKLMLEKGAYMYHELAIVRARSSGHMDIVDLLYNINKYASNYRF